MDYVVPTDPVPDGFVRSESGTRKSKDMTTFNVVVLLVIAGCVITAYISNIVMVDSVMSRIASMQKEEVALTQERENLRAEINMLSSYTRIQREAERLKLVHARQQPYSLIVPGLPTNEAGGNTE